MRRVQIPEEKMCPRLHLGSLFPSKQSSQIRFRPQSFRGQQCYQDVTGSARGDERESSRLHVL
ncbi:unnamed protein product [Linum tenue]|uniref:Uncharacterized protein n=2 Tax=Linum tenue TaxID=586396 RepID=A0AAV0HGG3_9ROSI|nr:unnamed protein product [Linum tenue]